MSTEDGTEEMLDLISAPDSHERTHFNTNEGTPSVYDTMCSLLRGHIMLDIEDTDVVCLTQLTWIKKHNLHMDLSFRYYV